MSHLLDDDLISFHAETYSVIACPHAVLPRQLAAQRFRPAHRWLGAQPAEDRHDAGLDRPGQGVQVRLYGIGHANDGHLPILA